MSGTFKNNGVEVQEYEFDVAVDGGATGSYNLATRAGFAIPAEAIIEEVITVVKTAFAGSGASASVGFTGSLAAYVANAAVADWSDEKIMTSALSAKAIAGANHEAVIMRVTGAPLTAGKAKVIVKFLHHTV